MKHDAAQPASLAEPIGIADQPSITGQADTGIQRLARLAVCQSSRHGASLLDRLDAPERCIKAAYRRLAAAPADAIDTSRAAEWLLDNHHIVRRTLRLLQEEFPPEFERRLPCFAAAGELHDQPRVYALACEIIRASKGGPIDLDTTTLLLREFQSVEPLTIAEVWALPVALRLVVLERLATVIDSIAPATAPNATGDLALRRTREANDLVATCVRSLRTLEITDWKTFVEAHSDIDRVLRDDPADVYSRMDFDTRDRYRKAVEELSSGSTYSETSVATEAVRIARTTQQAPADHVGYHLIGPGRQQFERHLDSRPSWRTRLRRLPVRYPTALYIGGIGALTLLAEALLLAGLLSAGASGLLALAALLLAAVPASTVATSMLNGLMTRLLPPSVLPKMDFDRGIPVDCQTLVAVPALLADADEVESLVRELEIRFLANRDPHLHFALLTDFGDASTSSMPEDATVLRLAAERVNALNARYSTNATRPFHLLHRPRTWSATEGCWMGWERKRGKLSDLNQALAR